MPYINQDDRARLDSAIDELGARVCGIVGDGHHDEKAVAGTLNYVVTRTVLHVVKHFGVRYWVIAAVSGMLRNVSDEFYRRIAAPYEDRQILKNGDVDLYEELTKDL